MYVMISIVRTAVGHELYIHLYCFEMLQIYLHSYIMTLLFDYQIFITVFEAQMCVFLLFYT